MEGVGGWERSFEGVRDGIVWMYESFQKRGIFNIIDRRERERGGERKRDTEIYES